MEDAGFFLGLPIQSLAIRVVMAALVAVPLVRLVLRSGLRSPRARVAAAFAPAVALFAVVALSLRNAQVPTVWVAFEGRGLPVRIGDRYLDFAPLAVGALVAVWLVIASALVTLRLVRVLRARRGVAALLAHADGPDARTRRLLRRVCAQLRVPTPRLAVVAGCPGGAAVIGVRRPALIIDERLVAQLDDGELEGVLAHEVAHIKRRDNFSSLALAFVRDVFFFVPGGAWAVRQLHDEREVAADQCAIEATRRPGALASGLLKVLDVRDAVAGCSALLPTADRGTLVNRVQLLIDPPTLTSRRRLSEGAVVAGAVVLASVTGVVAPTAFSQESGIAAVSLVWSGNDGQADGDAIDAAAEARAFQVYRSTPIQSVAAPTRGRPLDDPDEMRLAVLRACVARDVRVCDDTDPVFALGIRPRATVRLDQDLIAQWRAEQVLSTPMGLGLYVLRDRRDNVDPAPATTGRRLTEDPAPIQ